MQDERHPRQSIFSKTACPERAKRVEWVDSLRKNFTPLICEANLSGRTEFQRMFRVYPESFDAITVCIAELLGINSVEGRAILLLSPRAILYILSQKINQVIGT